MKIGKFLSLEPDKMSSPALSTTTRSTETDTLSTTKTTITTNSTKSSAGATIKNFNYAELFEDVDWNEVNLIDIEREWRDELDQIEKVIKY